MRRFLLFFAAVTLSAGPIQSTTACPMGAPLSEYMSSDFACGLGGLTFFGFSFSATSTGANENVLDATSVTVTPFTNSNEAGFLFVGPFSAANSIVEYMISFIGDPRPPIIRATSTTLTRGARRGNEPVGDASLVSLQCLSNDLTGSCEDYTILSNLVHGIDPYVRSMTVEFEPVSVVAIHTHLQLNPTNGHIRIQSFGQSLHTVPEPSSLTMIIFAGSAFLVFRRGSRRTSRR
jgi:hypothetical protein